MVVNITRMVVNITKMVVKIYNYELYSTELLRNWEKSNYNKSDIFVIVSVVVKKGRM